MTDAAKLAEVDFGLSHEEPILQRWAAVSELGGGLRGFLKGGDHDDFDFVCFEGSGLVRCYLEVKRRRVRFDKYGDLMAPLRKHKLALEARRRGLALIIVTEYACGTLVELDLAERPAEERDVARRDRPGTAPVPHVFYTRDQLTILEGASE